MGKLNFDIDEASLLKTYGLSTLAPTYVSSGVCKLTVVERWASFREWEDIDHELDVPFIISDSDTVDPLGLGGTPECVDSLLSNSRC